MQEITSNLMDTKQVIKAFGISRRTLCRWRKTGRVPKPAIDTTCPRWYVKDIQEALEALRGATA